MKCGKRPARSGKRTVTISSIEGHEGLYEFDPENPPCVDWEDLHKIAEVQ